MGNFITYIQVLKIYFDSEIFYRSLIAKGTYGKIYDYKFNDKNYVIKSQKLKLKDREELNKNFDEIIKEYFCSKIASAIGIGPAMEKIFGYDLLWFDDSLEFALEKC